MKEYIEILMRNLNDFGIDEQVKESNNIELVSSCFAVEIFDLFEQMDGDKRSIANEMVNENKYVELFDKVVSLIADGVASIYTREGTDYYDYEDIKSAVYAASFFSMIRNSRGVFSDFLDPSLLPPGAPEEPAWRWPVVEDGVGSAGGVRLSGDFKDFSALKMFGYTVGKTAGWPRARRQAFLEDFMERDLPDQVTQYFGDEYGEPLSVTRLRKVASLLANFCGLAMRNNPDRMSYAIDDWKEDLAYLKDKYYDGAGLKFHPWPEPRAR